MTSGFGGKKELGCTKSNEILRLFYKVDIRKNSCVCWVLEVRGHESVILIS